jgi:ferric-dicitrate binding protein FerR (iron transport regulator)
MPMTEDEFEKLDKDLTEEDWAAFEPKNALPADVSEKMLNVIDASVLPKKSKMIYLRWAAAAALIPLGFVLWKWTTGAHRSEVSMAPVVQHHWKEKVNHTGKTMLLALPDSSTVELADGSDIRFDEAFTRAVYLKGKGLFTVISDSVRPFTVYAGGLATTALATVFSVSCTGDSTTATEVSLFSGKVVVRPDSLLRSRGVVETLLKPGEQLRFEPLKQTILVRSVRSQPSQIPAEKAPAEKIMRFNNTPLGDIFRSLENEYHCRISYKNPDIEGIRFTGSFNSNKESLADFLNTIALLNNLSITEKNNAFYLK